MKDLLSKASMATIVSAVVIIGGLAYGIYTKNTDTILLLTGAGIGYLFKKEGEKNG